MAQGSAFFLVESIPASRTLQRAVRYVNLANFVWSMAGTICVIFRSHPPNVWSTPATHLNMVGPIFSACAHFSLTDKFTLWTAESIIAIVVETCPIVIPFWIVAPLQATKSKRTAVLVTFSFRIL